MTKNLIPTINISSILKENFGSTESIKTINKIRKACVNIGFFQVTGHGISKKQIQRVCNVGIKFFKSTEQNKRKLAPKKWNKLNSNVYRGYFPSDVNGKEGLDIGDPMISSMFVKKNKRKKIERLNLSKSLNKNSISIRKNYLDWILSSIEIIRGLEVPLKISLA